MDSTNSWRKSELSFLGAQHTIRFSGLVGIAFQRPFQKVQHRLAVPLLCNEHLKHLALMIHGAPKITGIAVYLHEHFVKVPAPAGTGNLSDAALSDLRSKQRAEPIPPQTRRLVADIDAALMQKVLDLAQRKRKADIEHNRKANDLG